MTDPGQDSLFDTPDDADGARAEYQALRISLAERVIGRDNLVDRLALAALLHRRGVVPQRMLFVGPSGAGKTYVAQALANVSGVASQVVDVQQITEAGWGGMHLDEILAGWVGREKSVSAVAQGVLVLDEVDKLAVGPEAHGNALSKYKLAQSLLLGLLGGTTPVRFGPGPNQQVETGRMMVIACGAFSDAHWCGRQPTSAELVAYGLIPELVDRLSECILVPVPSEEELIRRFREGADSAADTYARMAADLGFSLRIDEAVYRYAARWVLSANRGLREGGARIAEAAAYALAHALRDDLPRGTTLTVSPDDLQGLHGAMRNQR